MDTEANIINGQKDRIINQLVGLLDAADISGKGLWCQGWLHISLVRHGFWTPKPVSEAYPTKVPPVFKGITCKGAKILKSHCGNCEKCNYYGWSC